MTSEQTVLLIVLLAVVAVAVFALLSKRGSRRRQAELKARFGPEYDRAVAEHGNEAKAERVLSAREKRVHRQRIHPLSDGDRTQFSAEWRDLQTRFVDDPSSAVRDANELIKNVMVARGYAAEDFDRRVEDLSVEHANVIEHYRAARALSDANREGRANTEELRQAFVHYRALFADLLATPEPAERQLQEANA